MAALEEAAVTMIGGKSEANDDVRLEFPTRLSLIGGLRRKLRNGPTPAIISRVNTCLVLIEMWTLGNTRIARRTQTSDG
ncbi:hypothetical protein FRB95_010807 [Tulasnella sp. JGI-2019a]|nr:hypothetical protein FRB95_010807 [Tulasnella sp. JGI-2019a]